MSEAMLSSRAGVVPPLMSRLWWLVRKEARELLASRATWLLATVIGPLVGHAFLTAARTYVEVSGTDGATAALAQAISPLDGLVVPTFGAYGLVATLLLPFVAIRLISAEKESGAWALLVQGRTRVAWMVLVKAKVLMAAWMLAGLPGLLALGLWQQSGGHLHGAELLVVLLGHLLHGAVVMAVAFLAAALTDSAASAAVVTLGVTLGTWALDFVAQVQGGVAQRLARFTPESALRVFEQGELSASTVAVSLVLVLAALTLTVVALEPGWRWARRGRWAAAVLVGAVVGSLGAANLRGSADYSEDRRNSFAPEDEQALRALRGPIVVTAHLAPEDPRLVDLQRSVLHKLERIVPVQLVTTATTSTGLFERPADGYGDVWYAWNGRQRMTRSTTVPIVLETVYDLTGITPPANRAAATYPGYPHRTVPQGAAWWFYLIWPLCLLIVPLWSRVRARAVPSRPSVV